MADSATVVGGDVLAANMAKAMNGFLEQVDADMERASIRLRDGIKSNISLTDHSLSELADMDHPYASRHGAIQIHQEKPWQVHTQSGRMLGALMSGFQKASAASGRLVSSGWAGINEAAAPHALHVEYGTSKMLPRPFLSNSLKESSGDILETLRRSLKNTIINFNGRKVKL